MATRGCFGERPSDATNYLGGIAGLLERKNRRGALPHLGPLADVEFYDNDSQFQEVHYTWRPADVAHYSVRIWALES
jgi:hypothetical protein